MKLSQRAEEMLQKNVFESKQSKLSKKTSEKLNFFTQLTFVLFRSCFFFYFFLTLEENEDEIANHFQGPML